MTILKIITAPDPVLLQKSEPIEQVTDEIRALMDDMLETMYAAPGIGLAAIQIGVPKRILVIDLAEEGEPRNPKYFANPEILEFSTECSVYKEGCLSVPDIYENVKRPEKIKLRYLDYRGDQQEEEFNGLWATCLQHEMDHLNGILFIEHLPSFKRQQAVKKLRQKKGMKLI